MEPSELADFEEAMSRLRMTLNGMRVDYRQSIWVPPPKPGPAPTKRLPPHQKLDIPADPERILQPTESYLAKHAFFRDLEPEGLDPRATGFMADDLEDVR